MGTRSRQRHQKKSHRPANVTDPHHLEAGLDPSTANTSTSSPSSSSSYTSTSLRRRRTYRIGGLVAATTAVKAVACLVAGFYFFGGALLFCVVSLGCGIVLIEFAAGGAAFPNPGNKMWTLAQFETFGALSLDAYVRFLVSKLAVVWSSIAAIHKSAVNYSFTVSIAETPSLLELENLLDGRIPLLAYEGVSTEDEWIRSRATSLASSICDGDATDGTAAADGGHTECDPLHEEVYYSIDMSSCDGASSDDEEWYSEVEEEPHTFEESEGKFEVQSVVEQPPVLTVKAQPQILDPIEDKEQLPALDEVGVDDEPKTLITEVELRELESQVKATVTALRSVMIPLVPLAHLVPAFTKVISKPASDLIAEPLLVPSIKPCVHDVPLSEWVAPESPATTTVKGPPALKRRVSVSLPTSKPTHRLVVKPRPSTLTPPQSVQRMLEQAETMLKELNALLAAGNELLHPSESESTPRKSVRFCDVVDLIDVTLPRTDDGADLDVESLFYGSDEIESMSAEYFASISIDAC